MISFLFGTTKKAHVAGKYNLFCKNCKLSVVHTATLEKRAVTVLFIPVLPLGSSKRTACNKCGLVENSWQYLKHPYAVPVNMMAPTKIKPAPKPVHIDMPPYPPAPPKRQIAIQVAPGIAEKQPIGKKCPACGVTLVPGDEFCGSCGEEI